ncbi:DUF418 domain-containing protein [Puniceicoccus vermicola]|uniref:DUF418 domain-containing protein n=1 Tax=Puniceicoccus vermicola TaxID=388746 RepID=A0A7X1E3R8_9BACT|nr:DUF418 domain-containing protein [Puniceicoccus vermicola]MBC2601264.1 DUF418 domain-containing protein [Puniceicoccus vermicola]
MNTEQQPGPVDSSERLVFMDGLRGMALGGIFLVNMGIMAAPSMAFGPNEIESGPISTGVSLVRHFLADGAFFFLFSLLFGAGFSIMMGPFGRRSGGIGLAAYYRRLLLIGIFGFLHVWLFWWGDILMIYALAGAWLPLFRKRKDRTLLIWAVVLVVGPYLLFSGLLELFSTSSVGYEEWEASYSAAVQAWISALLDGYRSPDFSVVSEMRWEEYFYNLWGGVFSLFSALGYMLLGLWFARHDRFRLGGENGRFFQKMIPVAVALAILGKAAYVFWLYGGYTFEGGLLFWVGFSVGGPASGLVYFGGLRWFYLRGRALWLQKGLEAAGRMALTQYLLQSAFISLLFYGYGFGLYGKVSPALQIPIVLGFFALQVLVSVLWFRRFSIGPLEWILRKFTYAGSR